MRDIFRRILIPRGVVYKVTNKKNGKVYIGKTTRGLEKRKKEHYRSAFEYKKATDLYRDMREYGRRSFQWKVLGRYPYSLFCHRRKEKCDLCDSEAYYIAEYNSRLDGYNRTNGHDVPCSRKEMGALREFLFRKLTEEESGIATFVRILFLGPFLIFFFFFVTSLFVVFLAILF